MKKMTYMICTWTGDIEKQKAVLSTTDLFDTVTWANHVNCEVSGQKKKKSAVQARGKLEKATAERD